MKKIAASDSRQSVGLKWKTRKGLEENVAFKEDGTMEVGKNIKVDGTLTLNTPEDLAFKTGTISSEPEGYSVDGSGNVTIAGALKANNNGDVEVLKNLEVDGKAKLGYVGKRSFNTMFGAPADFFVHEAVFMGEDGQFTKRFVAFYPVVRDDMVDGEKTTIIGDVWGLLINNKDGTPATTIDEALNGELDAIPFPFALQGRWQYAEFGKLRVYSGKIELSDTGGDEANLRLINTASQAKYQHTVTIKGTRPAQGGGACFLTFTAYSPKNTRIDSAQDLIGVFGGCDLSVSGMYSPSQGTNFGAVKLYLKGASTIADVSLAYIDPSLVNEAGVKISECGNLSFSDDVLPE